MRKGKIEYNVNNEPYLFCPECGNIIFLDNIDSEGDIIICNNCEEEYELEE